MWVCKRFSIDLELCPSQLQQRQARDPASDSLGKESELEDNCASNTVSPGYVHSVHATSL